jgi:hypothetical protein
VNSHELARETGHNKGVNHAERPHGRAIEHMPTMFQRPDRITQPLDVILTVFNNARWRSRWKLYEDFVRHAEASGDAVRIWTVEVIFGAREAAVTDPANPRHLQLYTTSELWHKERSQNLLVQRVIQQHPDAEYFAFIDADVTFTRHDWADETRQALQHYDVVQMWRDAYDLDAQGNVTQKHKSFAACRRDREAPLDPKIADYYYGGGRGQKHKTVYWHPGYAWAWRRRALEGVGGLIDHAILGSADFHMAYALIGRLDFTLKRDLTAAYVAPMTRWQDRAYRHVKHNVGCMHGSLLHHWHGAKADRKYKTRWLILEETRFDPTTDLTVDALSGLYRFEHAGEHRHDELRDLCRAYFHQRDEDATR